MDVNSRDPSQNILPFRIKGVEVARFDICGNLGIGTNTPSANLEVVGTAKINGELFVNGRALNSLTSGVVVNMDSQPAPATALNRQKKQSIPLATASTLSTSDIIAKMSGVSVGKTQTYGVGAAQMASYGNIVVAVGDGTNSIAYSLVNPPTASSWVGIPNSANTFTTRGNNIVYANGTWVAVGEGTNCIAYSTMTPPIASSWVGIPTGSSFNGVINTFGTRGYDIAYGNGAWVAVGNTTNTLTYSLANPPTAETWVGIPTSTSFFSQAGASASITYSNGTWIAVGYGSNCIAYSTRTPPTADSWTTIPLSNINDAGIENVFSSGGINVTYANGIWLVAGQGGTKALCYSVENPPIASSWIPITLSGNFASSGCVGTYGNGTWVACIYLGSSTTIIFAYSTSQIPHSSSWVTMNGPTPASNPSNISRITFNSVTKTWYFLGGIGNNCMFYSTATPPVPATWIGVQKSAGAFMTQAYGAIGITTPAFTSPINVARLDNKVTFPVNRMLAVGGGGNGIDVVSRSTASPAPATTGTISYSDDDGATWAMVPGGATNSMFSSAADIATGASFGVGGSQGANAVAWNGEKWVAGGNGRTHSLAFSDDGGMTWSGITGKSVFSVEARDIAWNGQMWVAVGRGINFSTAYSYDGITWIGPVDVSGAPVNVFSYDIAGPTAAMSDISGGGNHVVWTGKIWVATGTRTLIAGSSPAAYYTVAYSVDGKTWTGVADSGATSTGFDMYAYGVAWNGRNLIVTGCGTVNTLAFSTDASSSWQGLGNTVFSIWGRGITWGARRWMATGRGTNTVAFSTNGRNWQGCGANVFKPMRRFMAMGDTGLYTGVTGVISGQPQRGVAFSYSDDGVTWDAPVVNQGVEMNTIPLYSFSTFTFTTAGTTGRTGPSLGTLRANAAYSSTSWTTDTTNNYLNMERNGIQLWKVPVTGIYTIRAVGSAGGNPGTYCRGRDIQTSTVLTKGEVIQILVGQQGVVNSNSGGGGGGTFVVRGTSTPIIVAGGGGGRGQTLTNEYINSNASSATSGNRGGDGSSNNGYGGIDGGGGGADNGGGYAGGGGGLSGNGANEGSAIGGSSFINGGIGGGVSGGVGGFGGGGHSYDTGNAGGGGGYSGGGGGKIITPASGGGGGSYAIAAMIDYGAINTGAGSVTITLTSIIPVFSSSFLTSSTLFTNNTLFTNAITDNVIQHTALMYSTDAGSSWSRVPGSSDASNNGGTGMTVANGGCYSIATNTARTRFIAGGGDSASATSKVYFSNDGFNWNRSVSSPNSSKFAWVYASLWVGGGYNRWLIGGSDVTTQTNGRIMYSGDADAVAAWIDASAATYTGTIISCFASNTDFTVILAGAASGNKIYRSAINGGATWTTIDISNTPIGSVRSIAFSPSLGRWVAVGGGAGAANTIIYSTDATGTVWIAPPIQAKAMPTAIFKNGSEITRVIWDALNGGRFIIGGYNGVSDYASFTNVAGADGVNNNPGYTMAYSSDGVNWTPATIRASETSTSSSGTSSGPFMTRCREIMALDVSGEYTPINTGYSVTWNSYANRFVATGNGTTPVVYSSDGGATWTPANQQPPQQAIAVAGGAGAAAGTGTASPITYTIDGKTWSQGIGAKEIFGAGGTVLCVKYGQTSTAISPNGRIWVAGATSGSNSCLAFSQNGIRWTAIANANTMITNVRTIVYAPDASITASSGVGNGVWVAGGDTTNSLIFSYDGISWSEVPGSLGILTMCNACAFGNGIFVAGGTAGTTDPTAILAYSTDGINWQPIRGTVSRISSGASIKCITYGRDERGRGLWVAGVSSASGVPNVSLLYSYNGIDWIGVNNSSSLSTFISGIAYGVSATTGQGIWVASVYSSGSSYSFIFSTTGRDGWTTVTNTKSGLFDLTGTNGATGIAYSNGVWYATGLSTGVSTGRTLAYSYQGTDGWFGVYPSSNMYGAVIPTFSATGMYCIATTNDYMIPSSTAGSPTAMVPVRSIGWTAGVGSAYLQHPTLLFGTAAATAATTAATTAVTAVSTDGGRSWGSSVVSLGTSAFRGGVCNDAFWNGSIWVAVGYDAVSGAKVATSKDGVTWSQIPTGAVPISGILYSVMWNGTIWMVGGDGSPTNDVNTASVAWSSDLTLWNAVTNTDTKLYLVKRISWNGMYWVAVGLGTVSAMMYSKDRNGLVWEDTYVSSSSTNKTATITSAVNDVVWGGGRWVAVGRGNDIVGGGGVSILYSADTPVVGGEPAEYAITGRRWTGVPASAQLFPYGASSVCWNGKRFVATGPAYSSKSAPSGNIIAWSADGISWTAYSTTKTVAPGQRWVAVGSGSAATIATSADGRTWTDVSGSSLLFSDISGANTALVNTMGTGARAIGWNGNLLIVGGARSATTRTDSSLLTATETTGRTTIPVCAFIGSGNGVMGGGTTNGPMDATAQTYIRNSSSVFITHLDVNMREASAPYANMWLNTYTDLSATQLFQVTPESQSYSSALKWNGWSWVANFGMTTISPITGEKYGSIWYCTDPLARVGWSVASNYATPRILMGQGGYAALEWNGAAWLACGYDPNNNNLIYTTDKYGATGWTAVSGIVSSGSASFQPVCIASSSRFWVVGGSLGTTSALYYTNDRTGATGWKAITASTLPGIRITSVGYNGTSWICCGGGRVGTDNTGGFSSGSISWRVDADDIGTGWAAATVSGTSGGFPSLMSTCSAIAYNAGTASPIWVVVGDVSGNIVNQVAYTTSLTGSIEWKTPSGGNSLGVSLFSKLNGIAWTGYSWIASCGAGASRIASTMDITTSTGWNNGTNGIYAPTLCTNAVTYANIPISLLTTGMSTTAGVGAGSGAMWRSGVGRAQGLLPGGGGETTSVVVRSSNGAEGITWSQTYSRNFLIAVGGGVIRDAMGGGGANRMAYSYDGGLTWTTNNSAVLTNSGTNAFGTVRTVKYSNGMWVAGGDVAGSSGSGNNCLAWSRDGVNWTGAGGTQIFGSAGACYAVCCNDRGRWVAVGGAPLGTAGTYTNASGSIYTMAWSDDGMNWTPVLGSRALFGIVCQGVSYGADASGVGMWTAIGRGATYTGCAYSYDGKTWYLSQTSGSLFGTSVNVLTERYAGRANGIWLSISLSSTGQYQSAVERNIGYIWTSSDYGVTWTSRTAPGGLNWYSISLSSTGQYQTATVSGANNIWTSSDYGVTWTYRTGGPNVNTDWVVSLSSTGQYQSTAGTSQYIWTSSDYGVTWTSRATSLGWNSISLSSTGQYQTATVSGGKIWTSSDYGLTWALPTGDPGTKNWMSVSLSSTGQYQSAVVYIIGNIWTSSDYGVTWTSRATSLSWKSISLSSTGKYQSAIAYDGGNIWISSNFGVSWTERIPGGSTINLNSISLSSTGQYQTAVVNPGLIFISSNFGETWSSGATDSRSLGVTYGKDASGAGMWVATAGRRDRDISASAANTMAYSYDGKLWRGIAASVGLSEQAWSVAYGKDGFGVGMWVCAGYDRSCGLKWSYDGITWNASMGASGSAVWASMAAGRRALCVYWNGSMWLASTSDTRNGEPRGTGIAANNASTTPGYLLYSYNGKNWLPVLAPNTYASTISSTTQTSVYSVLPNPAILDFGSFYDDSTQRGAMIANTTARTVGAVMSSVPIENVNTIVPYGRGSLTTGQVPFLLGGDSGLMDSGLPVTSDIAASTTSLSTSVDGGITWRAVPNSTKVMTKVNKILCDESTQQIVAVGAGNYSVATSTPATAGNADGWVGVFGSRMTNTRAGLFEKYGTGATWFGGAKMWIASGRTQSRRGSSLAVSVNGTVWQDAKIVSQMAAGTSLGGRGGGLTNRTTTGVTMTSSVIPYTAPATPLLTYTDSAAAFSTQVGSVATNSQYNRAVVGGSGVQFVAGGRGIGSNGSGLVYSNDGQNWTAASSGAATVFQTPTNVAAYSTAPLSGGFDASFGTVALTQRLTVPATYPSGAWLSGSLSSTGQYQSVVVGSGNIWTSSDYSVTWTERIAGGSTRGWSTVSLSSTGQYQSAVVDGGNIWTSSDFGVTWTERTTGSTREWKFISLSSTGQYQSAVVNGNNIWTSSDYGVTWTERSGPGSGLSISLSRTGQYQSTGKSNGGRIWTSSDYGVSWTSISSAPGTLLWVSISLSGTGQYQSAVEEFYASTGGKIWTSSNFGVTWTERTAPGSRKWYSISLSSTGQYQSAVVDGGNIWTSSDFGVTWTSRAITLKWNSISLSSSGQYQSATTYGAGSNTWTSTNFGVTWVQRSTATKTNAFTRIKSSASGQYQLATSGPAGDTNGQLYVSSDYGQTWIPRRGLWTWLGGAVSATGAVMMGMAPVPPTIIKINNALSYSPILYLDATNSSSYNGSTNTWTNLGSLGGNVSMSLMGTFDSTDNGGSFNFNGSSNYGTLSVASTSLTQLTYVGVVKPTASNSGNIISFGVLNPEFYLASKALSFYSVTPTYVRNDAANGTITDLNAWYHLAVTVTSTGALTFYINGVSSGTATGLAATWTESTFGIGAATDGQSKFNGKISSLAAYNRVLTASEIYNLYLSSALIRSTDYGNTFTDITGTALTGTAYWRAIAATNSASTQTAVAYGGSIYRSFDFGATWSNTGITIDGSANANIATPRNWLDVAIAAETGATQVTCVSGGYLYYSGDTGATWVSSMVSIDGISPQTTNRAWQAVALSANGQYGLACVNSTTASGFLYRSLNYGASWSSSNIVIDGAGLQTTSRPWQDVGMSGNGKYQVACLNNSSQTAFTSNITSVVGIMVPPPGALTTTFGSSWTQRGGDIDGEAVGDQSGYSVSLSADGTVVAIGAPMNFGANGRESGQVRVYALNAGVWTQRGLDIDGAAGLSSLPMVVTAVAASVTNSWYGISISSTGQYQTATADNSLIYVSSNFGVTWAPKATVLGWRRVSMSASGQYQTASGPAFIWVSSNFGMTWTSKATGIDWEHVALSSTGQYQTALSSVAGGGKIWTSSDYGMNWYVKTTTSQNWRIVSLSASGQYQTAVANASQIWISSDFGQNWTPKASSTTWSSVSISSTGQYQTAVVDAGQIWISSDFGQTWAAKAGSTGWYSISISSTGQYQSAAVNDALIWISSDFGMTWTSKPTAGRWTCISISSTGQYQSAVVISGLIYFSRDYGFTWSTYASYEITEGDRSGTSVSLSANGSTVAVGAPYYDLSGVINRGQVRVYDFSTNSLWIPRGSNIMVGEGSNDYSGMSMSMSQDGKVVAIGAPFNDGSGNLTDSGHVRVYAWDGSVWAQRGADIDGEVGLTATNRVVTAAGTRGGGYTPSIYISSTGQYQTTTVLGGNIAISSNYGISWLDLTSSNGTPVGVDWMNATISSTGQYQTALIAGGSIYISNNYGTSWSAVPSSNGASTTGNYSSISMSSNGQYQSACVNNTLNNGIYISSNYGINWTLVPSANGAPQGVQWSSISISSTGQYQSATVFQGTGQNIYTSSDYGTNWTSRGMNGYFWQSISVSSNGQYQSAVVYTGGIYISTNFGINWTLVPSANGAPINVVWYSISVSSTGQYQSAIVTTSGGIYTSSNFGITWTLVPSANGAPINVNWYRISLSSTGQYQSAVVQDGLIYFSRDYGFTWSTYASYEITTGDQSGTSVSLSADGSVVAIGATLNDGSGNIIDSGQVRVYSWSGSVWSRRGAVDIDGKAINDQSGYSVSMSSDGTVMAIGAPFSDGSGNILDSGHVRVYGWNGTNWIKRGDDIEGEAGVATPMTVVTAGAVSPTGNWYSVSISSTGQYQSAVVNGATGNIYTSSDYGVTWTPRTNGAPTDYWNKISISSSGQYQSAVLKPANANTPRIYTSSDFGVSWSLKKSITLAYQVGISVSSTGQYQSFVAESEYIYNSSNYGVTWNPVDTVRSWTGISVSATGQFQSAVVNGGNIYTSSDFGVAWTPRTNGAPNSGSYYGISISSTGQYQTALVNGGYIYNSSDFGVTWTPRKNDINRDWRSISVSSTGQYQSATVDSSSVYTSSDFGNTWTLRTTGLPSSGTWHGISVSSTGQYQSATLAGASGLIYFSRDYGFTWSTYASYEVVTGGDQSGVSVSLSANGNTVAIGAPYNDGTSGVDRGQVRVYDWNAGTNKWAQRGLDTDGEAVTDLAGWSVSLSSDGSTVAFGAPMNDGSGNLLPNSGSVRVYNVAVSNPITYTSSDSGVADICGNLLIIKGAAGTSNIVATQGATTTNGTLNVSGATYTLVYTLVSASTTSFIYYSKDYGASWSSLTTAGSRSWSSIALSANGGTISATTNDASGAIFTYTTPDDQYYRPPALLNTSGAGSTTTATVRAITYGNSGTGAATDGYWVAGADASANTLAYSSNGMDWTAVVGSKTTLFNSVNGVAYGADLWGAMMWVAVGAPFVGSVPGSTAYSIAYSYNMTTWTGVRNLANFTGQGNHIAYGQDEYGTGMWVAVGQGSGALAANLGSSSLYNSNGGSTGGGTPSTTIFYSYDGVNWSAGQGTGVFSTSGTDIAWGVDASGVTTWVATGVGYTDLLTGVVIPGGQVAHSTNGRVWTPIRVLTAITPALTPTTFTSRINVLPPPPASTGFVTSIFGTTWGQLGLDILGTQADEYGGIVSLSADGTTVAIGSSDYNVATGTYDEGRTRVYKYNGTTSTWGQLGLDISGNQANEYSGYSVSLSADGTTVAIGSFGYNIAGTDEGRTRVYKYNGTTSTWGQLGLDISGNQANERSGYSVSLSADGTTVAIGSYVYNISGTDEGRTRVYKYNGTSWGQLGLDISGNQADEISGYSVSLSADGTVVAIGSRYYDVTGFNNEGRTRIYKYNGTTWGQLGLDISGNQANENSGGSVSLSADGTTVAIGSFSYNVAGTDEGRTRVYKYNNGTSSWGQLGLDILGNQVYETSGYSVSLSADGTVVAIGSVEYDKAGGTTDAGTNEGRTRVYKYNGTTWGQLGLDISGNQANENSGGSVSISADGTTVAIGSRAYDKAGGTTNTQTNEGRTRIYKLDVTGAFFSTSNPAVADICGNGLLLIKDISAGTTTITATQPATPPFSLTPVTVQGTLTVTGTVYTLIYNNVVATFTPFTTSALTVAYGRGGSQGAGAPLWMVGGSGGNVFAMSSAPTTTGAWSVIAAAAPTTNAPFPICNSIGYSNGIWVAGNNTDDTNVLARSIDGGSTWTPVPLSSVNGILAGSASVGVNAFCNYSLAYADYSNDTNLRSWIAIPGTKNFMFEGGVNTVATVSSNIVASAYNSASAGTRAWWVAGGSGTSAAGVSAAVIAYSTDPSGAMGWTKSVSAGVASLVTVNDVAFSPQTQRWLAVGAGASGASTQNVLFSDASGATWTATAVATPATPVITLNTCIWNQLDASASASGRWLAGGTRNDISVSIPTSATLYISTDVSGSASPWTPIAGTGAILSQVYSAAFNGRVWIAVGVPATDSGSTSTLMSTTDPTGAAGWQGIATTNASTTGFDTAARSIAWNADQQMWIATGENTSTAGSGAAVDASFSSVIYSLDVSGSAGTWRTVRESNSTCFSGQGNGIAFTGRKWLAVGEGTNQIVATTDMSANTVFGTGAAPSWSSAGNANTVLPTRGTDIAFTGRNLIATGVGNGSSSGVVISTDPTGGEWSTAAAAGFTDASGGGTSITFEPTYDGAGRLVATGKSATNSITVSSDNGATWNTSATTPATGVQLSSQRVAPVATTQSLFTMGGNSVAYVGNDTLLGGGGNDVHWTGKRWIATGKNSGGDTATAATATASTTAPDITNNNTAPIAVSDDGITWQCVSSGQAPNITEGIFVATNSRIGATPLIDSRITIMDGGDTEPMTSDYSSSSSSGGMGAGIAQLDIIAELPVTSVSASNTTATVATIGVGSNNTVNSVNGVGVTPVASFDNTAFTITTRPV